MAHSATRLADERPRPTLISRASAITGAAFVVLFAAGLVVADLVATTTFPTPTRSADDVVAYFTENRGAVRALATLHAFAALALLVFAAHLCTVLRAASTAGTGMIATLAAAGGATAAGFLLLDAALFWVLALPSTTASQSTLQAIHSLSYLVGGVALALPLAVLIAATTAGTRHLRLWPRWVTWLGTAATITTLLYGTTLLGDRGAWSPSGALVTFATLPLLWVGAASTALATTRRDVCEQPPRLAMTTN